MKEIDAKSLSRRAFLRGAGFSLALPFLPASQGNQEECNTTDLVHVSVHSGFAYPGR